MYKLIALDLDGTLTNHDKIITPRTFDALMMAQRQGVRIVLASGRPTYGIVPLAKQLEIDKYGGAIMAFNGGKITDWATKQTFFEQKLDDEIVPLLWQLAEDADMAIVTYRGNEIVTTDASSEYVKEEARINRMPVVELDDFLRQVEYPLNKCLIVGTPEKMPEVEQKVAAATKGRISVYTSAPFFLECVPLHIDKAQSLARLIEKWGITKDEVMACGDGHNDLSMIEFAGMGVAMDNADDIVKQAANYVTLSNEEDGVGVAVEKFVLNR